jgi:hypothetical protein
VNTIRGAGAFALAAVTFCLPATGFAADAEKAAACMSGASAVRVYSVVEQDRIEAQYYGAQMQAGQFPPRTVMPPNTPIVAGALGGAIAGLIIEKSAEASNRHFAEDHLKPLQDATQSMDLRGALQAAAQGDAGTLPWVDRSAYVLVNGKFDAASVPVDAKAWIVLQNHYALSPDFAALVVRSDLELYRQQPGDSGDRWRTHPCYETTLVYQSKAIEVPAKTEADRARLVAEENAHWDLAAINRDIQRVNDAGYTGDPEIRTLRRTVADRIQQHKQALQDADAPNWTPGQRADWLASAWAGNNASELQAAIIEGGHNVDAMMRKVLGPTNDPVVAASVTPPAVASTANAVVAATMSPASPATTGPAAASTAGIAATSGISTSAPEAKPARTVSIGKDGDVYSLPVEEPLDVGAFTTGQ